MAFNDSLFYICWSIVKTSACDCFKVDFINIFPHVYDQKQRIRTLIGRGINEFKELILQVTGQKQRITKVVFTVVKKKIDK